eukprot:CAMPEP_0113879994 /NCGR_PEP_ID=MMETSP0780_2-20120614/7538_1 /TAXON_ID=652834 /ORGANISM="Palpitomonas bilix" /LENGTH=240 /DNA_ID=CAMNT_0000866619 /DNA_START=195 /DNA_END=917 /DNA_ORIENTATION=- /assembly_acc=CAM_ASM_000599
MPLLFDAFLRGSDSKGGVLTSIASSESNTDHAFTRRQARAAQRSTARQETNYDNPLWGMTGRRPQFVQKNRPSATSSNSSVVHSEVSDESHSSRTTTRSIGGAFERVDSLIFDMDMEEDEDDLNTSVDSFAPPSSFCSPMKETSGNRSSSVLSTPSSNSKKPDVQDTPSLSLKPQRDFESCCVAPSFGVPVKDLSKYQRPRHFPYASYDYDLEDSCDDRDDEEMSFSELFLEEKVFKLHD